MTPPIVHRLTLPARLLWEMADRPVLVASPAVAASLDREGWRESEPAVLFMNSGGLQEVDGRHRLCHMMANGRGDYLVPVELRFWPRRGRPPTLPTTGAGG